MSSRRDYTDYLRDKLIHDNFGVDLKVVWRTVYEDLPPLRAAVVQILADLGAERHLR